MTAFLQKRWGGSVKNPNLDQLRAALAELATDDAEHPDCSLSDEEGWCISAFGSGTVVFENVESGEGPWHMRQLTCDAVLELWQFLQNGDLAAIRAKSWLDGY